jgi:hypothetical protein
MKLIVSLSAVQDGMKALPVKGSKPSGNQIVWSHCKIPLLKNKVLDLNLKLTAAQRKGEGLGTVEEKLLSNVSLFASKIDTVLTAFRKDSKKVENKRIKALQTIIGTRGKVTQAMFVRIMKWLQKDSIITLRGEVSTDVMKSLKELMRLEATYAKLQKLMAKRAEWHATAIKSDKDKVVKEKVKAKAVKAASKTKDEKAGNDTISSAGGKVLRKMAKELGIPYTGGRAAMRAAIVAATKKKGRNPKPANEAKPTKKAEPKQKPVKKTRSREERVAPEVGISDIALGIRRAKNDITIPGSVFEYRRLDHIVLDVTPKGQGVIVTYMAMDDLNVSGVPPKIMKFPSLGTLQGCATGQVLKGVALKKALKVLSNPTMTEPKKVSNALQPGVIFLSQSRELQVVSMRSMRGRYKLEVIALSPEDIEAGNSSHFRVNKYANSESFINSVLGQASTANTKKGVELFTKFNAHNSDVRGRKINENQENWDKFDLARSEGKLAKIKFSNGSKWAEITGLNHKTKEIMIKGSRTKRRGIPAQFVLEVRERGIG